jgi:hypothetical protein
MGDEDRLLDEALRSYIAEPRPGLELRVLAGMRPRPAFRRWAWLIPVFACLLPVVLLLREPEVELPPRPVVARAEVPPALPQPAPALPVVASRLQLPRQQEFPARRGLTTAERALVNFTRVAPVEALQVFSEKTEPIQIEEIKVEPLKIGNGSE